MPRKAGAPAPDPAIVAGAVDALGRLQTQLSELRNEESRLKDLILSIGGAELDGTLFRAKIIIQTRSTIDVSAAKAALGKDWVAANSSVSTIRQIRVAPRADVAAAAATKLAA